MTSTTVHDTAGSPVSTGRLAWSPLSDDDARRAHDDALALLEQRGVSLPGEGARAALAGAGIEAGGDGRVCLPAEVVAGALETAPSSFTIGGRDPGAATAVMGAGHCLLAAAAAAPAVLRLDDESPRSATALDVIDACRLADAFGEVAAVWSPPTHSAGGTEACGCPLAILPAWSGTAKHLILVDLASPAEAQAALNAAAIVAGDDARDRPPLSVVQTTSTGAALDAALTAARAGLPAGFLAGPVADGDRAPGPMGDLVAVHAALLAACTLQQLAAPGSPFVGPMVPGVLAAHARSAAVATDPRLPGFMLAVARVAAIAGLPLVTGLPAVSSSDDGWEAAVAKVFAGMGAALAGPSGALSAAAGLLDDGAVYSFREAVLDIESWSVVDRVVEGIAVDDETTALETIKGIGIGGTALGQRHTRAHMKDVWRPRIFDRTPYEAWDRAGRAGARELAAEVAATVLRDHQPEPLPDDRKVALQRLSGL